MPRSPLRSPLVALERRWGLTPVGVGLLVSGVAAVIVGRVIGNPGLGVIGIFLLLAVVGTWALTGRRVSITATREALPPRVRSGRIVEGGFEVTSARRVGPLQVIEHFPAELRDDVRLALPELKPGAATAHRYVFAAERRGVYEIGPLTVVTGDPFGIVRRTHVVAEATRLVVHPRVDSVIDRIVARRWEDPAIRPLRSVPWPTGAEFYGMHEYQPGDDTRRIVWSALARHDEYLVREAEQGVTDRVTILLDTESRHWAATTEVETFEAAVRAAASVGNAHLENGFSVTVATNGATVLAQTRGRHHRLALLDALAEVGPGEATLRTRIDGLLADRASDGHYVVITSHIDTATAQALRVFASPSRSLLIVLVINESTDAATRRHASALRCAVVEIYGAELLTQPFRHALGIGRR